MLILSRSPGESIVIGEDVTLTVLDVQGAMVKLGIDAPKDLSVHREEIYLKIKQQDQGKSEKETEA